MKVRELYSDPSKWCQGSFAVDANGETVSCNGPAAVAWCLIGAVSKCYGYSENRFSSVSSVLRGRLGWSTCWNDAPGRTFEEVKRLVEELDI